MHPACNYRSNRQIKDGFGTAARHASSLKHPLNAEAFQIYCKNNSYSGNKNAGCKSFITLKFLIKSLAVALTFSSAGLLPAQAQTPSTLNISKPNGYATTVANDFNHKTVLGAVKWTRVWDGYEWKFNPHWESLSTSWGNLTGSQSANTTVGDIPVSAGTTLTGVDKPPNNLLIGRSTSTTAGSSGGSGGGCWAWVDEDWQPTYTSVMFFDPEDPAVTMEREAGPMIPLRSTPFNRGIQGEAGAAANTDYVAAKSVSIDYATLCPGGSDSGIQTKKVITGNLYLTVIKVHMIHIGMFSIRIVDIRRYILDNHTKGNFNAS